MAEKVQLSQAAFDRLKAEHDDLTTRGRIEIARKIETARELGDLSENGDYHAAKEEKGKMEGRVMHLASILRDAVIIEGGEGGGAVVAGTVIGIRDVGDDEVRKYLLGSIEERVDDLDVISAGSPLGKALMGHRVGDFVEYETPTGDKFKVELVSVEG